MGRKLKKGVCHKNAKIMRMFKKRGRKHAWGRDTIVMVSLSFGCFLVRAGNRSLLSLIGPQLAMRIL